jgi:hypothetical protein
MKRQERNSFLLTMIAAGFLAASVGRAWPEDNAASPAANASSSLTTVVGAMASPSVSGSALVQGVTTQQIVDRLTQRNLERAAALHGFESRRSYQLSYEGFPSSKQAQMEVLARYQAPEKKTFDVISESGSKMFQNKVFAKLLETEQMATSPEHEREVAVNTENYSFTLLGSRPSPYGGCYRMAVEPKRENKWLYKGEICVNAADFAVESIDAEPAKSPSFWIRKTRIQHHYRKIGEFWVPASNRTVSNMRLGGTATLEIVYSSYELR